MYKVIRLFSRLGPRESGFAVLGGGGGGGGKGDTEGKANEKKKKNGSETWRSRHEDAFLSGSRTFLLLGFVKVCEKRKNRKLE